jgi:predicted AlkP superfamily pyrophosphatase or phosphodiesterase
LLYKAGGRSVSLSLKARSAIGMAGHAGTDVIWFDERNGWFTTSTAFARQADPIVAAFVRAHPVDAYRGRTWERTLPPSRYLYDDEADGERPGSGWGSAFPHPLGADDRTFSGRWEKSPFSDDYLEQMAEASIDGLKLGQGSTTDFLGISFSALDLVGHAFGPRSHEVQDVLVRLDATIDRLLRHLDETVGRDRYVVALSADHGVSDVPEQVNGARLSPEVMVRVVDAVLRPILKDAPPATLQDVIRPFAGEGVYVAAVANTDIYLREGVYDRIRAVPGAVDALVRGLGTIPSVARVLRSDELSGASARSSADPLIRAAALSYVAGRSGDLVVVPVENAIASTAAATHGTAYEYDQRIPVIFYGAGVRTGRYTEPASSADIAVTLGARAGVSLPLPDGHVLAAAAAR